MPCKSRRTSISGAVSFDRIAAIISLRVMGRLQGLPALNSQYAAADELGNWWGYRVANESPSTIVQPSGKPINFSHSFQVKFLAT